MSSRQEYVDLMKSTFVTAGRGFTEAWLAANVPVSRFPIIRHIVDYYVGKLWQAAADSAELGAFIVFIDLRVSDQGKEYEAAAVAHHQAQINGTPEEKANAEAHLRDVARRFFSLKS